MTGVVECSRMGCRRTTRDPKAADWAYMDQAPDGLPHWVGWWCPKCFHGLQRLMKEHGVDPIIERVQ